MELTKQRCDDENILFEISFSLIILYFKIPYITKVLERICFFNIKCLYAVVCASYYLLPNIEINTKLELYSENEREIYNEYRFKPYDNFDNLRVYENILTLLVQKINEKLKFTLSYGNRIMESLRKFHYKALQGKQRSAYDYIFY